jgi:RNA polymerase sigma-70 factor (ECF subfamily)
MKRLEWDEKDLVRQLLAGKDEAFDFFFHSYYPPLYRFSLARLKGNVDAAEETAHAALCNAIQKLETYRGEASLFVWLRTFCRHEIFAWRSRHTIEFLNVSEDVNEMDLRAMRSSPGNLQPGPEEMLLQKDIARLVQDILDTLPDHYGEVLELKYLSDLSVKEIAQRMKTTEKAVESVLTRARKAFRNALLELGVDPIRLQERRLNHG